MGDIGLFISSFGGLGILAYYLIDKDKTTNKEMIKGLTELRKGLNDLTFVILELLDELIPNHSEKRTTIDIKTRLNESKRDLDFTDK